MKKQPINLDDLFTNQVFEHYVRWLNSFPGSDHVYMPAQFTQYSTLRHYDDQLGIAVFAASDGDDGGGAILTVTFTKHTCPPYTEPFEIYGIMQTFDTMSTMVYDNTSEDMKK